ncbi:hypothetical protein [Schaedlerella arabinosiphila]|uniref:hypothetical protein n=1 Tax=Schaedlerella arabinosiphila TaxID=2044587 RepID=UPI0013905B8D|nr:hypothetical protein [Schaedlerella arabinosiphila]
MSWVEKWKSGKVQKARDFRELGLFGQWFWLLDFLRLKGWSKLIYREKWRRVE